MSAPARPKARSSVGVARPRLVGRRVEKSAAAFRTISEVADDLDVPQHVLRFWETKFPQVRPLKRGGGRRYYRPEDVDLLRNIRRLLYDAGYTIKGVQRLLREGILRDAEAPAGAAHGGLPTAAAEPPPVARRRSGPGGLGVRQRAELDAILRELVDIRDRLLAKLR